jgi:hypothetical protein
VLVTAWKFQIPNNKYQINPNDKNSKPNDLKKEPNTGKLGIPSCKFPSLEKGGQGDLKIDQTDHASEICYKMIRVDDSFWVIEYWNLGFIWNLVLEIWDFFSMGP